MTVTAATRVLVLMGGRSAEREVSLASGAAVAECLAGAGHPVRSLDLGGDRDRSADLKALTDAIESFRPDVVFVALHGPLGEDGTVQGALELAAVPYTGSGVLASALGNDKVAAKRVFVASRITTPRYAVIPVGEDRPSPPLPLPVVVKPRALGSSLGVSIVREGAAWPAALEAARAYGQDVLVEEYIAGRELQAGVIDGRALPLIEVRGPGGFYDYAAKYTPGGSTHVVPAPLPKRQYEAAQQLAASAYAALGCAGAARVELIASETGTLYVLEVNTVPGLTATSLLPEAAREAGMSFLDLVRGELEGALRRARRAPVAKGRP